MERIRKFSSEITPCLLCALEAALLCAAAYFHSFYVTGCGLAALWLGLWRLWALRQTSGPEARKQKRLKFAGALLLLPALVQAALSVMPLLGLAERKPTRIEIAAICALAGVQMLLVLLSLVLRRKENTPEHRVIRHFDLSLLCSLLTVLVSRLLWLGDEREWASMVCLTGCVLGGVVLLLGCNLLLCALCGWQTTKESIRVVQMFFRQKKRLFGFASVGKDGVMVLWKLIMSIVSTSFFMFANALFSCGIGIARFTALKMNGKRPEEQLQLYRRVAAILSFSGLCYVGYSIRLFFGGTASQYGQIMGIAIACYTFVEFGIQIRELLKLRKDHDMEAEALRLTSLSTILISFVLTQTALMSFSEPGEHNFSDGLAGVVFGGLVVLVGLVALIRSRHRQHDVDD